MNVSDFLLYLDTTVVLKNSLFDYLIFLGDLAVLLLLFHILQLYILQRLSTAVERTHTRIDDVAVAVLRTVKPPFYAFLAFYLAVRGLTIEGFVARVVHVVLVGWVALQVVLALQVIVDSLFAGRLQQEENSPHKSVLEVLRGLVRFVLWVVGLLFVLSNLGINITSLIAGLGIGGIAVALASQNILSDLFNSLVLYFDQPFSPGDFIEVDGDKGTVLKIGVKTTRIRSLTGEEIIVPNKDIAAARVKNYKRLSERRITFMLAVDRSWPLNKMEHVPEMVQEVVKEVPKTRFSRASVHEINDNTVMFEVVYFVTDQKYDAYVMAHQKILLSLLETLGRKGIKASAAL